MFATSSQHARQKLVTSLATCTLCRLRREGSATWKKCSQHRKRCSQHEKSVRNTLRNIMIRRLICFLIRIMWLGRCPMLAPGSDIRALQFRKLNHKSYVKKLCIKVMCTPSIPKKNDVLDLKFVQKRMTFCLVWHVCICM
jgi:hypothetical protein